MKRRGRENEGNYKKGMYGRNAGDPELRRGSDKQKHVPGSFPSSGTGLCCEALLQPVKRTWKCVLGVTRSRCQIYLHPWCPLSCLISSVFHGLCLVQSIPASQSSCIFIVIFVPVALLPRQPRKCHTDACLLGRKCRLNVASMPGYLILQFFKKGT